MSEKLKVKNRDTILKAQEGDAAAFRALVDEYKEQAVRIAYSITGNIADAQDVAQDAFIRVYKNLFSFKFDSKFSTWIYRIVVNLGYDFLRKKKRSKIVFNNELAVMQEQAKDGKDIDPGKKLMSEELKLKIDEALKLLPPKQQIAFSLKYRKDMKSREIAELMNISISSVKAHLFRAANKMREKLKEYVR